MSITRLRETDLMRNHTHSHPLDTCMREESQATALLSTHFIDFRLKFWNRDFKITNICFI